jgi:hypothetical protein
MKFGQKDQLRDLLWSLSQIEIKKYSNPMRILNRWIVSISIGKCSKRLVIEGFAKFEVAGPDHTIGLTLNQFLSTEEKGWDLILFAVLHRSLNSMIFLRLIDFEGVLGS